MLPVSLTIEGLYSYKKPQTIDFEKLTSNQIFGIFGEVGSGKSSILEAIVFALYGETDRLNKSGDNRYYNMMNLQSDRLLIDFICKAGTDYKEEYRFVFEAKRNSKNYNDVKARGNGRRAFKKKNAEWIPLENWNTQEIIGMNYNNFRQTIIIPQGKFREFIEQTPTNRTKMLQDIFRLNDFDLSDKTKSIYYKNEKLLTTNRALYDNLEEYSEGKLTDLKSKLETIQVNQKKNLQLFEKKQQEIEDQKELKQLFEELSYHTEQLKSLNNKKDGFLIREKILQKFRLAYTFFKEKITLSEKLKNDISQKKLKITTLNKEIDELDSDIINSTSAFEKAEKSYHNRDIDKKKCEELKKIIKSIDIKKSLLKKQSESQSLKEKLGQEIKVLESYELEKNRDEGLLIKLKNQLPDVTNLLDSKNLLIQNETINKDLDKIQSRLLKSENLLNDNYIQRDNLLVSIKIDAIASKKTEALQLLIKARQEALNKEIKRLDNEINALEVKQEFANHAINLVDGEPCLLCGATHHPNVLQIENVRKKLEAFKEERKQIEEEFYQINKVEKGLIKIFTSIENELENKRIIEGDLGKINLMLKDNLGNLKKRNLTIKNKKEIEEKINFYNQSEDQIKALDKAVELRKEKSNTISQALELKKEIIQKSDAEVIKIQTQLETILSDVKLLTNLIDKPKNKLVESLEKGELQISEAEQKFKYLNEKLQKLKENKSKLEGAINAEQSQFKSLKKDNENLNNDIEVTLEKHKFSGLENVKEILNRNLDIDKEENEIKIFNQQMETVNQSYLLLKKKAEGKTFDHNVFKNLIEEIKSLDNQRISFEKEIAVVNNEIEVVQEKLKEKKSLKEKVFKLENKADNIKTLLGLFKSKGFVEYVSTVYLQNLVLVANKRFMQLTKNNLSLELSETNDFIVRDYLNNGKTRLLKTLSGGQMFQAALCLALALAENVKSLNQADKSFFFLDEGFGTLDKSSLQTVFATLKSLKKEQRLVGVISHIEELQQEIEVNLKIKNDKEKGSLVSYSWE